MDKMISCMFLKSFRRGFFFPALTREKAHRGNIWNVQVWAGFVKLVYFCIFDDFIRKLKPFIVGQFNNEWATVFVKARSRIFNMYFIIRM